MQALFLVPFCLLFPGTAAYSQGAPCAAFDTMEPNHFEANMRNVELLQIADQVPYSIKIYNSDRTHEPYYYKQKDLYLVEITATAPLPGILLQAREVGTENKVGEFVKDESFDVLCLRYQQCGRQRESITHAKADCAARVDCTSKSPCLFNVTWKAMDKTTRPIHFVMTAVVQYKTIFTRILSRNLQPDPTVVPDTEETNGPDCSKYINANGWDSWCDNFCDKNCCPYYGQVTHQCQRSCCERKLLP